MLVDSGAGTGLDSTGAVEAEAQGYAGVWTAETNHDPFLPLALAARDTQRVTLGTSIAVAFARSPMTTAVLANDIQLLSKGRMILGLGSQIKAHIEKRFSMPWSHPAPRMREYILAMRAIWACWNEGTPLQFRGEFYTHTLMTPFFDPGKNPWGAPKVYLAGVGELMTEVAGETCDGFLSHSFTTERYLREKTIPALQRGRARAPESSVPIEISMPAFIVTGRDASEMETARRATKQQIAFYGSTPAYRGVLELHGWGALGEELNSMSKKGLWVEMGERLDDEILDAFAVVGEPASIAPELVRRFGDVVTRISFYTPGVANPEVLHEIAADLRRL